MTKIGPLEAREALRKMAINSNDIGLIKSAEHLLLEPEINGSQVDFGPWRCNLKDQTFVLAIDAPPMFAEYSGVFECHSGEPIAKVTNTVQN